KNGPLIDGAGVRVGSGGGVAVSEAAAETVGVSDGRSTERPGQPASAALTASSSASTVTAPSRLVSKARHRSSGALPSAMRTPTKTSSTVTAPSSLQSPTHVAQPPEATQRKLAADQTTRGHCMTESPHG